MKRFSNRTPKSAVSQPSKIYHDVLVQDRLARATSGSLDSKYRTLETEHTYSIDPKISYLPRCQLLILSATNKESKKHMLSCLHFEVNRATF